MSSRISSKCTHNFHYLHNEPIIIIFGGCEVDSHKKIRVIGSWFHFDPMIVNQSTSFFVIHCRFLHPIMLLFRSNDQHCYSFFTANFYNFHTYNDQSVNHYNKRRIKSQVNLEHVPFDLFSYIIIAFYLSTIF
jgi:hypothetical protein